MPDSPSRQQSLERDLPIAQLRSCQWHRRPPTLMQWTYRNAERYLRLEPRLSFRKRSKATYPLFSSHQCGEVEVSLTHMRRYQQERRRAMLPKDRRCSKRVLKQRTILFQWSQQSTLKPKTLSDNVNMGKQNLQQSYEFNMGM